MNSGKSSRGLLKIRQFVIAALSVFALLASVRAQGAMPPPPPPPHNQGHVTSGTLPALPTHVTSATQPIKKVIPFDQRWLMSNINLHNRMIAQSKIEAKLTTSTTIKTFTSDFVTTLGLEVAQMQTMLKTWYGISPPTIPAPPAFAKDPVVIALLSQDLVYLNQVILYEETMIIEGLFPASKATHADLKTLAKKEVLEAKNVLALVEAWQDLLIKIALEQLFL
jgi:hypothetical protein